ncbi:MAG: glycerate kinase [Clostridia bacterium]|nr:glycerate kinase [Clostridia bacterium]
MNIIIASDSFKGTLSSREIALMVEEGFRKVMEDVSFTPFIVADGGEGTLDAVQESIKRGQRIYAKVHDPLMRPMSASYLDMGEGRALIEMAEASGLTLLSDSERDPMKATSYGTGELVRDALIKGFRDITVAIGGSATNDGGMGFLSALGARFMDEEGNVLPGTGEDLEKIRKIDLSLFDTMGARFTVMCDVQNPLTGEKGATYVYGPQKGANEEKLIRLEKGMRNYRACIIEETGEDPDLLKGSGAAGGMGAALMVFLKAEQKSGINALLDMYGFDEALKSSDLVITGEGRADRQSAYGKVLSGIGRVAWKRGVPVIAVCGSLGEGYEELHEIGITSFYSTMKENMSLEYALSHAEELYRETILEVAEDVIRNEY